MSQDWGNQPPGQGGNPPWGQPGGITPQPTPPWQQPGAGANPPWAQPGATPPWAPGAGGGTPPGQRPPSKKPIALIAAAVAGVLVLGGIVAVVASGGGGDDDDDVSTDTGRQTEQTDETDDTDDTRATDETDDTQTEQTDDTQTEQTDDTQSVPVDGEFVLGITVSHPFPGDLAARIEVYDADDQLLCGSDVVEATGQPSEEQTVLVDPSDCADFYPPGPDQRWFVGVADLAAADVGTLDEVALVGPDGDFYVAFGLPIDIPDEDPNGVYVELTA